MNKLKKYIDLQIKSNKSKNLFYKNFVGIMRFTQLTFNAIQRIKTVNEKKLKSIIDYTTEKVLREFCRVNQYYSFSENNVIELKCIYWELYINITQSKIPLDIISKIHYENLKNWLEKTNPFSRKKYKQSGAVLTNVACCEYSAELQKDILFLNNTKLLEPVLDVGCGRKGNLVKSLIDNNYEAYGIDRFANNLPYFEKADWLKYDYKINKWGTIISNLGFSNHFVHHHFREDGNIIEYTKKYIDILKSLKIGGSFYYSPALPFVEEYLDEKTYFVTKHSIKNIPFNTTIITRLK